MHTLTCPACGGDVTLKSRASVFVVCAYCKATLLRGDSGLATIGTMADVQLDPTPLQIGTQGKYNKQTFTLIGRLRVGWADGYWSEWYALFDDGRTGWLAEAQGFYAMSFEVEGAQVADDPVMFKPGFQITLPPHGTFMVEGQKDATCVGSEGELPFSAPKGRQAISVDLVGPNDMFASIEFERNSPDARLYVGHYVDFDEFKFAYLRELHGW